MLRIRDVQRETEEQAVDRRQAHEAGAAELEADVLHRASERALAHRRGRETLELAHHRERMTQTCARRLEQIGVGDVVDVSREALVVVALRIELGAQRREDVIARCDEAMAIHERQPEIDEPHVAVQPPRMQR